MTTALIPDTSQIEKSLDLGLQLRSWFQDKKLSSSKFENSFKLKLEPSSYSSNFAFFDVAMIDSVPVPVMGQVDSRRFEFVREGNVFDVVDQLREFVFRYLLRISDFAVPADYSKTKRIPGNALRGFGFEHKLSKTVSGNLVDPQVDKFKIPDLRMMKNEFDWMLLDVDIFDFDFSFAPFGSNNVQFVLPLAEQSFVVTNRRFVEESTDANVLESNQIAKFTIGYSFVPNKSPEFLAYGPGQFELAFQTFSFAVYANGEIRLCLEFVANRPKRLVNLDLSPVNNAFRIGNLLSPKSLTPYIRSFANFTPGFFRQRIHFDPIFYSIDVLESVTKNFVHVPQLSRQYFERLFLSKHFDQHDRMVNGIARSWSEVPDWTKEVSIPVPIISGEFDSM